MRALRRYRGPARKMRHVDREKHRLIPNISQPRCMEEVDATHEFVVSAQQLDQPAHIVRHEELVLPDATFKRRRRITGERAPSRQRTARNGVLEPKRAVEVLGLEVALKARVGAVDERGLVWFK